LAQLYQNFQRRLGLAPFVFRQLALAHSEQSGKFRLLHLETRNSLILSPMAARSTLPPGGGAAFIFFLTRTLPALPLPESQLRVLVLLSPAQPQDAQMTLGKALPGPEQFDIRARQVRQSAPWITVAPYFARNLTQLFDDSQKR
jgi:hypothetical protein